MILVAIAALLMLIVNVGVFVWVNVSLDWAYGISRYQGKTRFYGYFPISREKGKIERFNAAYASEYVDLGSVEQSDRYALERAALDPSRELFFW